MGVTDLVQKLQLVTNSWYGTKVIPARLSRQISDGLQFAVNFLHSNSEPESGWLICP